MITTAEHVTPERIELVLYVVKFCLKIPLAPNHEFMVYEYTRRIRRHCQNVINCDRCFIVYKGTCSLEFRSYKM